jgi:hypothetical protein
MDKVIYRGIGHSLGNGFQAQVFKILAAHAGLARLSIFTSLALAPGAWITISLSTQMEEKAVRDF